jgi:hypothetical protein
MVNSKGYANILYWLSIKYKRVIKSVLASKLYIIAHGFNIGASIKSIINKALGINLLLVFYINSKLLYNCLIKLGTT